MQGKVQKLSHIVSSYCLLFQINSAIVNYHIVKYPGKIDRKMGFFDHNPMGGEEIFGVGVTLSRREPSKKIKRDIGKVCKENLGICDYIK